MLFLYTTLSCFTAGEVISTALYCKNWSYSPGERSELRMFPQPNTISFLLLIANLRSTLNQNEGGLDPASLWVPAMGDSQQPLEEKLNGAFKFKWCIEFKT